MRRRPVDMVAVVLALAVAGVLIAGMASIHPGPVDMLHDVLQDWTLDFLER